MALDKEGAYRSDSYNGYYANDIAGVFGGTHTDDRRTSKQSVLGVLIYGVPKAYPRLNLYDNPVLNDSLTGKDLVVTFDAGSLTGGFGLLFEKSCWPDTFCNRRCRELDPLPFREDKSWEQSRTKGS